MKTTIEIATDSSWLTSMTLLMALSLVHSLMMSGLTHFLMVLLSLLHSLMVLLSLLHFLMTSLSLLRSLMTPLSFLRSLMMSSSMLMLCCLMKLSTIVMRIVDHWNHWNHWSHWNHLMSLNSMMIQHRCLTEGHMNLSTLNCENLSSPLMTTMKMKMRKRASRSEIPLP
jgi:hypothetical protein